jgi:hypothetical protein
MIDKRYGKFYPTCDGCGEELEPCDSFDEAKESMRDAGWEYSRQFESNLCPICQKEVHK